MRINKASINRARERPLIAFFDYTDVFEDFYPHYGVSQYNFAKEWTGTGNHSFLTLLQRNVGDVIWYEFCLTPKIKGARHDVVGCEVKFVPSSLMHRAVWKIFYLPKQAWRWRGFYSIYAPVASYLASLSWRFLRTLFKDKPDILFVQDYANGRFDLLVLLARILGARIVAYHAGSCPKKYLGRFAKHWSIPAADYLIVSSRQELEMLASDYGVSRERMKIVLTPIDTDTFSPRGRSDACRAAKLDPSQRHFLFVGRLDDKVKRVGDLIRAFVKCSQGYPAATLLIIGEGVDGANLRRLAAELDPERVRFLGWVKEKSRLSTYYNAAECLLLPSVKEGFPTVVGEAMACGTPVMGSDVGGVGEMVVPGKTGWLLPPGDTLALRTALEEVLSEPHQAFVMRENARQMAQARVAPDVVAAQLHECFLARAIG